MTRIRSLTLAAATLAAPIAALAQAAGACYGAGAAFGVVAYSCGGCTFKTEDGRTLYTFEAEPIITEVASWSVLRPGDVIEAVGDRPITTSEGAEAFVRPVGAMNWVIPPIDSFRANVGRAGRGRGAVDDVDSLTRRLGGRLARGRASLYVGDSSVIWLRRDDSVRREVAGKLYKLMVTYDSIVGRGRGMARQRSTTLRVRRNGKSLTFDVVLNGCNGGRGGGRGARGGRGFGEPIEGPASIDFTEPAGGKFGFATMCTPSCRRVQASDGTTYWKYDSPPAIYSVRTDSPADKLLRIGDTVTKVDGLSILEEKGAIKLLNAGWATSLQVTVRREGKEVSYTLSVR